MWIRQSKEFLYFHKFSEYCCVYLPLRFFIVVSLKCFPYILNDDWNKWSSQGPIWYILGPWSSKLLCPIFCSLGITIQFHFKRRKEMDEKHLEIVEFHPVENICRRKNMISIHMLTHTLYAQVKNKNFHIL